MWLDAAEVCQLTYKCPFNSPIRQPCRKLADISLAWRECAGPENCKRIAFIFDYYGSIVHQRALSTTHKTTTASEVMRNMGIVFEVAEMKGGSTNCVQQQYSSCAKTQKFNLLRGGCAKHGVRVNLGMGKKQPHTNWKRPKEVFFIFRDDTEQPGVKVIEKVSCPAFGGT